MNAHDDIVAAFARRLRKQADAWEGTPPRSVGYRERVQIERHLFLLLKVLCRHRLRYSLRGLTEVHRKALLERLDAACHEAGIKVLVRDVFELHAFLRSLSSAHPYVQGDALSRVAVDRDDVIGLVVRRARRLADDAIRIARENH